MLAATPPRRTTRSSTRKDSETLASWSASSCSENRPGKCIRWSVAIEPATSTGTSAPYAKAGPRGGSGLRTKRGGGGSAAEGVAAGAAARGVGVVDREALLLDRVGEVDRGAAEVRSAHAVDDQRHAVLVEDEVAVEAALV